MTKYHMISFCSIKRAKIGKSLRFMKNSQLGTLSGNVLSVFQHGFENSYIVPWSIIIIVSEQTIIRIPHKNRFNFWDLNPDLES